MLTLEVSAVRSGYGRSDVLHGMDLRVPAGRAVALLGSNGAGKSTLLKTIAGLVPTRGGRIRLEGTPIQQRPANFRARAGICLIPEGRGIFRRLSVHENLAMHAGKGDVGQAIERTVALFPILKERLGQVAGTLSGGQQQMLALARALVSDPKLVMADELSVGLAPVVVNEILEAVAMLRAEGRSLLIVEQYVDRAVELADYVYIMHKGEMVFAGEPAQCASSMVIERYFAGTPRHPTQVGGC